MKYCNNCGKQIEDGMDFCNECSNSFASDSNENNLDLLKEDNVIQNNEENNNTNNNQTSEINSSNNKKEGLATASLIIGIISLILSFVFNIFILPIAIIGLVLGIVNKVKKGRKKAGIILNIIAIVISLVIFIILSILFGAIKEEASKEGYTWERFINQLYNTLDYSSSTNYVAGNYSCKSFSGSGESDEYIVTFKLNKDNTFIWGKYNDIEDNHFKGTYTFEDEEKTNNSGDYRYFMLNLKVDESIIDGEIQTISSDASIEDEFGITAVNTKKQGIIMNTRTYNMYYCYEE